MMSKSISNEKIAFLVNLDRRKDRWLAFEKNSINLNFEVKRFTAVDALELNSNDLYSPAPVAACWMSHQEVAKKFLKTHATHCLVLEDDVELSTRSKKMLNDIWRLELTGIDLLQIGFCVHENRLANRTNYLSQVILVRLLSLCRILHTHKIQKFLHVLYGYSFEKRQTLGFETASMTFELGTHAYLMSRDFAKAIIEFNRPVYIPADLAMMELVCSRKFQAHRALKNIVSQSTSPSSIANSSYNELENTIEAYRLRHAN